MKLHRIDETVLIPRPLDELWDFFADPRNLAAITPPDLGFELLGEAPARVYPGCFITYRVRPLFNLPLTWVTEIAHVEPPHDDDGERTACFIDDQRSGPYALWHHEHRFREVVGGTEAHDLIHYALPLDPVSRPVHDLLVRPQLRAMMDHRAARLSELFPVQPADATAPNNTA